MVSTGYNHKLSHYNVIMTQKTLLSEEDYHMLRPNANMGWRDVNEHVFLAANQK